MTVKNFNNSVPNPISAKSTPTKVSGKVESGFLFSPDKPQMVTKNVPSKKSADVSSTVHNTNKNVVGTTPKGK